METLLARRSACEKLHVHHLHLRHLWLANIRAIITLHTTACSIRSRDSTRHDGSDVGNGLTPAPAPQSRPPLHPSLINERVTLINKRWKTPGCFILYSSAWPCWKSQTHWIHSYPRGHRGGLSSTEELPRKPPGRITHHPPPDFSAATPTNNKPPTHPIAQFNTAPGAQHQYSSRPPTNDGTSPTRSRSPVPPHDP